MCSLKLDYSSEPIGVSSGSAWSELTTRLLTCDDFWTKEAAVFTWVSAEAVDATNCV